MKKIKNFVLGGIQQKVFNLVLITVILLMAAYTVVVIYNAGMLTELVQGTNAQQKHAIGMVSQQTMDAVINGSLTRETKMEAALADDLFSDLAGTVKTIADNATLLFASEIELEPRQTALPDPSKDGEISVQLLTAEGVDLNDPQIAADLGLVSYMGESMIASLKNTKIDSCYIALPSGVMILADEHSSTKFDENGKLIPIPVTERDWYTGAVSTGDLYFTDVTTDIFSGAVSIMCSMPIYKDGEIVAVAGADMFLDDMAATVNSLSQNGSFVSIINANGHVVFSPQKTGVFMVRPDGTALDLRRSSNQALAEFVTDALNGNTELHIAEMDGTTYYLAGASIPTVGWTVVSVIDKALTDQPSEMMMAQYDEVQRDALSSFTSAMDRAKTTIFVLVGMVLVLGLAAALILASRIVRPLEKITKRIGSLGGNDLQFHMDDAYRTGDEVEVLAESFAELSEKTVRYMTEVTRVTAEKERIGAELDMAKDIQASQLPRLFPAFPKRKEFEIYAIMDPAKEVGGDFYDFFLIDDDHIALVIADVSGKGIPAALFMMVSRVLIKSRLQSGETPGEALANVNNQLREGNEADLFVTVWLAVLEISTGKGVAVNSGHEHPSLRRAGDKYELIVYKHSPAVAVMEDMHFREHEFDLRPGDSLFVYTDGVAEATNSNNELFGTDRMIDALNRDPDAAPQQVIENVMDGINEFVAGAEQFDDITMLCMKYNGPEK